MDKNKKVCQACLGYLFEDDDIVVCPVCGAPHHRDCYNALGRCGVESNHGTPNQYDLLIKSQMNQEKSNTEAKVICPRCGKLCKDSENYCHNCTFPLKEQYRQTPPNSASPFGGFGMNFDSYAGFSKDTVVEDEVVVDDVKEFVVINSHRYIPKFMALRGKRRKNKGDNTAPKKPVVSWNWAAFLLPASWFFYRKMYFQGVGMLILQIASAMCSFPFSDFIYETLPESASAQAAIDYSMIDYDKAALPILIFLIGSLVMLVVRVLSGMFGNIIYKSHSIGAIKEIKASNEIEDISLQLAKKGGVNFWLMLISFLISTWFPQILYALL